MSVLAELRKNSTIKETSMLTESKLFSEKDIIPTDIPMINVALSGSLDGGLTSGLTMVSGPSKHFKTCFALIMAKAYLNKYDDGAVLFYDSEFGTPSAYFERLGIDTSRVIHTPITNVEELKHDLISQLHKIKRNDRVCILIDSLGNLASLKEVEDAISGKTVADMSRAKAIKSLFRMVTPNLTLKNIPMIVVNHTYKEIGLYPKDIVGGGTGSYYAADTIWIVGRQQNKEQNELVGYDFIIKVEKSRFIKEGSKIPITVNFDGGVDKYSGFFEFALEHEYIKEASSGFYQTEENGKKRRRAEIESDIAFMESLLHNPDFQSRIQKVYKL